jgi:hypothetical protein
MKGWQLSCNNIETSLLGTDQNRLPPPCKGLPSDLAKSAANDGNTVSDPGDVGVQPPSLAHQGPDFQASNPADADIFSSVVALPLI